MNQSPDLCLSASSHLLNDASAVQDEYNRALAYLQAKYPDHTPFLNKRNPYTGKVISSRRAFDEYVRQYALRMAYEKLFSESEIGKLYLAEKESFDLQLAAKNSELLRLQQDSAVQVEQLARSSRRSRRLTRAIIALVAVICIGIFKVLPDAKQASYNDGQTDGYAAGETAGYNRGYSSGETIGYNNGYSKGKTDGYEQGYSSGRAIGYNQGYNASGSSGTLSNSTPSSELPSRSSGSSSGWSLPSQTPSSSTPSQAPSSSVVYVSRNGVIHRRSNCSGMKYYTEMSYSTAVSSGYRLCSKCY